MQQRFDMLTRKQSIVDKQFNNEVAALDRKIKEQSEAISEKVAELFDKSIRPTTLFDDSGNVTVDDERARQIIQPMKDHLKLLKQKYLQKKALQPKAQREASSQADIFA